MANLFREQKLIDSTNKAVIKYVIVSDGTQQANTTLIDVSSLANALNANGYIMTSNTHPKSAYRTTIRRILGQGKISGSLLLKWQGDGNSEIVALSSGPVDFNLESIGGTLSNPEANASGDILVSTSGLLANDAYTLIIELRKDARDFDQGQTRDPSAFNNARIL